MLDLSISAAILIIIKIIMANSLSYVSVSYRRTVHENVFNIFNDEDYHVWDGLMLDGLSLENKLIERYPWSFFLLIDFDQVLG